MTTKAPARSLSQRGRDLFSRAAQEATVINPQELLSKLPFSAVGKKSKEARMWTPEEDALLRSAVERYGEDWEAIAQEVPGRNKLQCVQRWKKTLRPGLIKGPWKPEEDALLIKVMSEEMEGDWQSIARRIPGRNAKQCKERWMLNLNPAINHGPWTPEEDAALIDLHAEFGGKWSILAKRLTGRTEHAIKTRFLSLQKRAAKMRNWTVDEDRIVLKEFMVATNLNGVSATMKALPGRTKRQVQDRWRYLREHFVSIDDLATSNPQGSVRLTDQDLRNLVPHPSLTSGTIGNASGMAMPHTANYAASVASSAFSTSTTNSEERVKSLARRQGSSNPSQPFRHMAKRLEKSGSSSSASQRAQAQMGSELLNQAFGSSIQFGSTLLDGPSTSQGGDVVMTPMGPVEDPFVAGLINAGLQAPSMFASSSSSTSQNRPSSAAAAATLDPTKRIQSSSSSSQGGMKTLQHNLFSSSFLLPPLSPQPPPTNGEPQAVSRQDSFLQIASELEQLANGGNPSPTLAAVGTNGSRFRGRRQSSASMPYVRSPTFQSSSAMDIVANQDDVFKAFSGMAPELTGNGSFHGVNPVLMSNVPSDTMLPPLWVPPDEPSVPSLEMDDRMLRKFASSHGGMDMDIFDTVFTKTTPSMERSF